MTAADLDNLTGWYETTLGHVPTSITFGLKYHPEYVKVNRAKWEVAIKTLPKQIVPYLMLRHHTITGSVDGLREAALLAKAWGVTKELVVQSITCTSMYFTGFEGLVRERGGVVEQLPQRERLRHDRLTSSRGSRRRRCARRRGPRIR